jgi:HEAT repeat protein
MELAALLASTFAKQQWFWGATVVIVAVLLLANVALFLFVYARRLRELVRARRAARFQLEGEQMIDELTSGPQDPERLRARIRRLNELERPIAATMLLERLGPASTSERAAVLDALRETGAIELLVRSLRRREPWRRALAARTLGQVGATDAVPALIERLEDKSRHVREAAVRALGRIGDERALPPLADLFLKPGRAGAGIVYEALLALGGAADPVFQKGLSSATESVRVTSCFGVAAALAPEEARRELKPMLADPAGEVRAAACETLGRVSDTTAPDALAQATRDPVPSVRRTAVSALGSYDDPRSLPFLLAALDDPERDVALRAGESLVRLGRLPAAGSRARAAIDETEAWPLETARVLDSLGAV